MVKKIHFRQKLLLMQIPRMEIVGLAFFDGGTKN